jgi:hypothetical protein
VNGCPDFETLATWRDLPASDERRTHVESCPRCRARLAALDEFVAPSADDLPAGEWNAAREELRRRRPADERLSSRPFAVDVAARRAPSRWRFARLVGTLGAVVAVGAVAWFGLRARPAPALRESGPTAWAPTVERRGGTIRIAWPAVPQADAYRLLVSGPSLEPVATLDAGARLETELRVDSLPAGLAPHRAFVVQAEALRGTDVLATSRAVPLRIP